MQPPVYVRLVSLPRSDCRRLSIRTSGCSALWRVLVFAWAVAVSSTAFAQPSISPPEATPTKRLSQFVLESWGADAGLPQNSVNALEQTDDGFLWIGTFEGLARFDGLRIQPVEPALTRITGSAVVRLSRAPDDALWVATLDRGITRIAADGIQHWGLAEGLPSETAVSVHARSASDVWVGTTSGVARIVDGRVESVPGLPPVAIRDVEFAADGAVWVLTRSAGLFRVDAVGAQRIELPGDATPVGAGLAVGIDNSVWIGTSRGLHQYTPNGRWLRRLGREDGLASDFINKLAAGRDGSLWLGYEGDGVQRLDGDSLDGVGVAAGLPNGFISALFEDRHGNFWIGTNFGLARLRDGPFLNIGRREGLPGEYARVVIETPDGSIWVGLDDGGLARLHGGAVVETLGPKQGLLGSTVRALALGPDGSLWIAVYGSGLQRRLPDASLQTYGSDEGLPSNLIRALATDPDGSLWIGTEDRGLVRLREGEFERIRWSGGLPHRDARTLLRRRDGSLLIGTYGHGLGVVPVGADQIEPLDIDKLHPRVLALFEDAGQRLWIGGQGGLQMLENGVLRDLSGLGLSFERAVFFIDIDARGDLWMSGNLGLTHLPADSIDRLLRGLPPPYPSTLYDRLDGLRSSQLNGASQPAGWRDHRGRLWLPSPRGVAMIESERLLHSDTEPTVVIESAWVDGQPVDLRANSNIVLPNAGGRVELRFGGVNALLPRAPLFETRLHGIDSDWSAPDPRQSISYAALPPGEYRFEVRAIGPRGAPSRGSATVQLSVPPGPWQRLWVQVLVALILLLSVAGLLRLRELRLRRANQRLEAEIAARTHELVEKNRALEQAVSKVQRLSRTDALTGLANRRFLHDEIDSEIALTARRWREMAELPPEQRECLLLVLVDLDHFKRINDVYGHSVGDRVLVATAQTLRECLRGSDHAVRWGGEEFLLMLRLTRRGEATQHAARVLTALRRMRITLENGGSLRLTGSVGIAAWPVGTTIDQEGRWEHSLQLADAALYLAKARGRDRGCLLQLDTAPASDAELIELLSDPEPAILAGRLRATPIQ